MPLNKDIGLTQGLNDAVNNYYKAQDYQRNLQKAADKEARDKVLEQQQNETYAFQKSLRPYQLQSAQDQASSNAITLQQKQDFAKRENMLEALNLAQAGQYQQAVNAYNSAGDGRVKSIEPHPDDPEGKLLIATDMNDKKWVIDPDKLRAAITTPTKGTYSANKEGVLNTVTGQFNPFPNYGATAKPGYLASGLKLSDAVNNANSILKFAYASSFDPSGNPLGADNKQEYLNASSLAQKYMTDPTNPEMPGVAALHAYQQITGKRINMDKATAQATQEANTMGHWYTTDQETYGAGGKDAWIQNRAAEIALSSKNPVAASRGAPRIEPPQGAIDYLRANPGSKDQFESTFHVNASDYLPTTHKPTQTRGATPALQSPPVPAATPSAPAQKVDPRINGLMTKEQQQDKLRQGTFEWKAEQDKLDHLAAVQQGYADRRQFRADTAARFGLSDPKQLGTMIPKLTAAQSRVEDAINKKLLPEKADLEMAIQLAKGRNDQKSLNTYTQIINKYYGS